MRKLLLFVFAALAFTACEQAPIEEQSVIRPDTPDTITVGFEGDDDTRIQLNEAQKTVWTKGDLVSVFYRSNANQQWKYNGETGARTANLKRVDAGNATETMKRVVVVYPYNDNYYINTETYNVQASLPATQHYLANSYGLDGNIMISSAEYNDVTLKNVCGWLKLQLTGDGEVVKSITFKGNNGEQVAGELYINSAEATAILASDMGNIAEDDGNNATGGAGANLSFDDVVLKEVTLDCGIGVTLSAEATAFYIALPPQIFDDGFTVEVACADGSKMVKSSSKKLTIERNYIQPMTEFAYATNISPSNQIWYTSSDGNAVTPYKTNVFGATIVSNTYNNGKGVISFDGDVTMIGDMAFLDCHSLTSVTIPNSVTTIGTAAFCWCDLTSLTIPDSVTIIGEYVFRGCDNLKEFNGKFAKDNGRILVIDGTLIASVHAGLTEYAIPDSVTTIGDYAFEGCGSLISVTIPDSVTTIGYEAFDACTRLKSVTIGNSVTTISKLAFSSCDNLTEFKGKFSEDNGRILVIDGTLVACAEAALGEYYSIPDSVTSIGDYAFTYCASLISVTIPDSVTTIGSAAFNFCRSLTSVTIPDGVTLIDDYAFNGCTELTSVTIPDSVLTIGDYVFRYCSSMTSVTIPKSVTIIGGYVFDDCESLLSVYCSTVNPPALGRSAFRNNSSGRKIYVPMESVDAYKGAQYWSEYSADIVGYDFENGEVVE